MFRHVFTTRFAPEASAEQMDWFDELMRISTTSDAAERLRAATAYADVTLTRHAPATVADRLVQEAVDRVDQLQRHDGSYDQTFVRLDILAQRPR